MKTLLLTLAIIGATLSVAPHASAAFGQTKSVTNAQTFLRSGAASSSVALAPEPQQNDNPLAAVTSPSTTYSYAQGGFDKDTTQFLAFLSALCALIGFMLLSGLTPGAVYAALYSMRAAKKGMLAEPGFMNVEEETLNDLAI